MTDDIITKYKLYEQTLNYSVFIFGYIAYGGEKYKHVCRMVYAHYLNAPTKKFNNLGMYAGESSQLDTYHKMYQH